MSNRAGQNYPYAYGNSHSNAPVQRPSLTSNRSFAGPNRTLVTNRSSHTPTARTGKLRPLPLFSQFSLDKGGFLDPPALEVLLLYALTPKTREQMDLLFASMQSFGDERNMMSSSFLLYLDGVPNRYRGEIKSFFDVSTTGIHCLQFIDTFKSVALNFINKSEFLQSRMNAYIRTVLYTAEMMYFEYEQSRSKMLRRCLTSTENDQDTLLLTQQVSSLEPLIQMRNAANHENEDTELLMFGDVPSDGCCLSSSLLMQSPGALAQSLTIRFREPLELFDCDVRTKTVIHSFLRGLYTRQGGVEAIFLNAFTDAGRILLSELPQYLFNINRADNYARLGTYITEAMVLEACRIHALHFLSKDLVCQRYIELYLQAKIQFAICRLLSPSANQCTLGLSVPINACGGDCPKDACGAVSSDVKSNIATNSSAVPKQFEPRINVWYQDAETGTMFEVYISSRNNGRVDEMGNVLVRFYENSRLASVPASGIIVPPPAFDENPDDLRDVQPMPSVSASVGTLPITLSVHEQEARNEVKIRTCAADHPLLPDIDDANGVRRLVSSVPVSVTSVSSSSIVVSSPIVAPDTPLDGTIVPTQFQPGQNMWYYDADKDRTFEVSISCRNNGHVNIEGNVMVRFLEDNRLVLVPASGIVVPKDDDYEEVHVDDDNDNSADQTINISTPISWQGSETVPIVQAAVAPMLPGPARPAHVVATEDLPITANRNDSWRPKDNEMCYWTVTDEYSGQSKRCVVVVLHESNKRGRYVVSKDNKASAEYAPLTQLTWRPAAGEICCWALPDSLSGELKQQPVLVLFESTVVDGFVVSVSKDKSKLVFLSQLSPLRTGSESMMALTQQLPWTQQEAKDLVMQANIRHTKADAFMTVGCAGDSVPKVSGAIVEDTILPKENSANEVQMNAGRTNDPPIIPQPGWSKLDDTSNTSTTADYSSFPASHAQEVADLIALTGLPSSSYSASVILKPAEKEYNSSNCVSSESANNPSTLHVNVTPSEVMHTTTTVHACVAASSSFLSTDTSSSKQTESIIASPYLPSLSVKSSVSTQEHNRNAILSKIQCCALPSCQKLSNSQCGKCFSVWYCCVEHQKRDWQAHKRTCKKVAAGLVETTKSIKTPLNNEDVGVSLLDGAAASASNGLPNVQVAAALSLNIDARTESIDSAVVTSLPAGASNVSSSFSPSQAHLGATTNGAKSASVLAEAEEILWTKKVSLDLLPSLASKDEWEALENEFKPHLTFGHISALKRHAATSAMTHSASIVDLGFTNSPYADLKNLLGNVDDVSMEVAMLGPGTCFMSCLPEIEPSTGNPITRDQILETIQVHRDHMLRYHAALVEMIDIDILLAVRLYTLKLPVPFYAYLNKALNGRNNLLCIGRFARLLLRGLLALEAHGRGIQKISAYRGVRVEGNEVLQRKCAKYSEYFKQESLITFAGFTSVARDEWIASEFGDYLYFSLINVRGVDISFMSASPHEREVLIIPPAVFQIKSALKIKGKYLHVGIEHVVQKDAYYCERSILSAESLLQIGQQNDVVDAGALRALRLAADKGNCHAQFELGKCFLHGTAVVKDEGQALKWFRAAEMQGSSHARQFAGQIQANNCTATADVDGPRILANVFLSYNIGPKGIVHRKVSQINQRLVRAARPVTTIFNEERTKGNVGIQSTTRQQIESSKVVVVFLTEIYKQKINGGDMQFMSAFEFDCALKLKKLQQLVVVVLDPDLRNQSKWIGLEAALVGHKFVDMCGDVTDAMIDELMSRIQEAML